MMCQIVWFLFLGSWSCLDSWEDFTGRTPAGLGPQNYHARRCRRLPEDKLSTLVQTVGDEAKWLMNVGSIIE